MKYLDRFEVELPLENKLTNQLRIILKLAEINGYDIHGRIRTNGGSVVEGSDLAHLLLHCVTPQGKLKGEEHFIELLRKANIDPTWITNEEMKAKLSTLDSPKPLRVNIPTPPSDPGNVRTYTMVPQSLKTPKIPKKKKQATPPMPILTPAIPLGVPKRTRLEAKFTSGTPSEVDDILHPHSVPEYKTRFERVQSSRIQNHNVVPETRSRKRQTLEQESYNKQIRWEIPKHV